MRLRIFLVVATILLSAGTVQAQTWDTWRQGYERSLERSPSLPPRDGRRPINESRPVDDFSRSWEDAQWPARQSRSTTATDAYRDRRDPYSDSMYSDRASTNTDYRNPYRDYDDPDADGYGDSNRFNNDSDYLSPAELHYKSRYRPVFFSRERYDEREQRWDDDTTRFGSTFSKHRQPVTVEQLDISRYR